MKRLAIVVIPLLFACHHRTKAEVQKEYDFVMHNLQFNQYVIDQNEKFINSPYEKYSESAIRVQKDTDSLILDTKQLQQRKQELERELFTP